MVCVGLRGMSGGGGRCDCFDGAVLEEFKVEM